MLEVIGYEGHMEGPGTKKAYISDFESLRF